MRPWESQSPIPPPSGDIAEAAADTGSESSATVAQNPDESDVTGTERVSTTQSASYCRGAPMRRSRRDPHLTCKRWTARVVGQEVIVRRRRPAPCLQLAYAMARAQTPPKERGFDSNNTAQESREASPEPCEVQGLSGDQQADLPPREGTRSPAESASAISDSEVTQLLTAAEMGSRRHSRWSVFSSAMSSRRTSMMEESNRRLSCPSASSRIRGLPDVIAAVQAAMENCSLSAREKRESRETAYAQMLALHPSVSGQAASSEVTVGELRELTTLFAEFDGTLRGFLNVSALRSLLRRVGHIFQARDLVDLISQHWARQQIKSDTLDMVDILEIYGIMQAQIKTDIKVLVLETPPGPLDPPLLLSAMKGMSLNLTVSLEQLRRVISELGFVTNQNMRRSSKTKSTIDESEVAMMQSRSEPNASSAASCTEAQMTALVDRLRESEKMRAQERAGFTQDETIYFQKAYDRTSGDLGVSELLPKDLLDVLAELGIVASAESERDHLEDVMRSVDRDDNGAFSFNECLHLVRRFFDEAEVQAVLGEKAAAEDAGLPEEEVQGLREVFEMLKEEEADQQEFNYPALTKAVRLFGGTLSVVQSNELEKIYQRYAVPSKTCVKRKREKVFQLEFPSFLRIVGELWSSDFAGILTSSERWMEGEDDRVMSPITRTQESPRREDKRKQLGCNQS